METEEKSVKEHYEKHRPYIHYTSKKGWLNDPNGLIYFKGYYHLFYQHDPKSVKQEKMHWGHARTKDFIIWEEQPIALYPDELGSIFSGCMIYDEKNSSGLGKNGAGPLVAVFTHNYEKGGIKRQYQSLAYSLDDGMTFTKYEKNPVLDLGLSDFRDPKVIWDSRSEKWMMLVSAGKSVLFFASENLTEWQECGRFEDKKLKPDVIWECPDLQEFKTDTGEKKWVLFVSENTLDYEKTGVRYFVGSYDGHCFTAEEAEPLFLDFGRDYYAAAVYEGASGRILQQAWMNCWTYAGKLPESGFRGSMAFPRELVLKRTDEGLRIVQRPAEEWRAGIRLVEKESDSDGGSLEIIQLPIIYRIDFTKASEGEILFANEETEIKIHVDYVHGKIKADRSRGGLEDPYFQEVKSMYFHEKTDRFVYIILDVTSVEIFAAGGEAVGTFLYFTEEPLKKICWRNIYES